MPKRPRQSHIPKQQPVRRKIRRPNGQSPALEPAYAEEPVLAGVPAGAGAISAGETARSEPRPGRRMEMVRQMRETTAPLRTLPGQLPTYGREYLVSELRTIGIITASLLSLIIVLAFVLR